MESWYVTAVLNRCPHCQDAPLFSGIFKVPESCPNCHARYERWAGSWTGPTVGGYGIGAATAVILALVLKANGMLVPGAEWGIALAACVMVLATFRIVKGAWIGMLYDWGYIYPDPLPAPPTTPAVPSV